MAEPQSDPGTDPARSGKGAGGVGRAGGCGPACLDAVTCGVVCLTDAGTITFVNAAAAELVGRSADDLIGRPIHDPGWWPAIVLDADEQPSTLSQVLRDAEGCIGYQSDMVLGLGHSPEGPVTWVSVGVRQVSGGRGDACGLVCTFTPITGSHRSTRQLWARAGRLRALLDHLPDTYFVLDSDDQVVEWFGGEVYFLAGTRRRLLGEPLAGLFPDDVAEHAEGAVAEVRSGLPLATFDLAWGDEHDRRYGHAVCRALPEGYVGVVVRDATERWLAEQELLTIEEQYRLLTERAHDVIGRIRCSPVHRVEYLTPSIERLVGYPPSDFYRDDTLIYRIVCPEMRDELKAVLAGRWDYDEPWECCFRHKDGREVWVEERMQPVWSQDGSLAAIELVARDVTERRRWTEELRRSEELFRLLVEESRDVVWRVRMAPTPMVDYVSPSVRGVLGHEPDEFLADPDLMRRITLEEYHDVVRDVFRDGDRDGEVVLIGLRHRDGRTVWAEMVTTSLRDRDGRLVAVQGVMRDITALHEEHVRLLESEERFRLLVEHSRDVVWRLRLVPERRLEYVSPVVEQLLGYTAEELLEDDGRLWGMLTPESRRASERTEQGQEPADQVQVLHWTARDGRQVVTEGTVSLLRDEPGRVVALQGVARDVTGRGEG